MGAQDFAGADKPAASPVVNSKDSIAVVHLDLDRAACSSLVPAFLLLQAAAGPAVPIVVAAVTEDLGDHLVEERPAEAAAYPVSASAVAAEPAPPASAEHSVHPSASRAGSPLPNLRG